MNMTREQKMIHILRTTLLYDGDGRVAMHITENAANMIEDLVQERDEAASSAKSRKAGFADDISYHGEMAASYDF